jgi:sec-independent protein translocase protein TatA
MVQGLFQPMHLIIILAIVLVVFGPGKLANVGGAMGKSIKEFKEQSTEPTGEHDAEANPEPIQVSALAAGGAATISDLQQKVTASDPSHV